jgi:hypothetical protein
LDEKNDDSEVEEAFEIHQSLLTPDPEKKIE